MINATSHAPASPWRSRWQRFSQASIVGLHRYATWLVGISWKRFFVLSVLLLITAAILESIPPFSWRITETIEEASTPRARHPKPPAPPTPPREPVIKIEKPSPGTKTEGIDIKIDERGIRITPRAASAPAAGASASPAASSPVGAGSSVEVVTVDHKGREDGSGSTTIRLSLPPSADAEAVREALKDAAAELKDAARAAREEAKSSTEEATTASVEISDGPLERVRHVRLGDFLSDLALLWIVASMIIKITYKGQLQARAEAAQATETAEAEQLKRQVVEARMAAMQAQVEPHFLFNTLASIDHLIETDPPRASRMQKSLIALLRATMPAMREGIVNGVRDLGREIAVIEPYLEILKVRMEERLETRIDVPEGLRSAEFPPMMVQGLVENAIKHGLEPKAEGGTLSVQAQVMHGQLVVTVTDTGVGFGQAATAGTGTGLDNIRERLRLLYGDQARLDVSSPSAGGTQATVTLPYKAHVTASASARTDGAASGAANGTNDPNAPTRNASAGAEA